MEIAILVIAIKLVCYSETKKKYLLRINCECHKHILESDWMIALAMVALVLSMVQIYVFKLLAATLLFFEVSLLTCRRSVKRIG